MVRVDGGEYLLVWAPQYDVSVGKTQGKQRLWVKVEVLLLGCSGGWLARSGGDIVAFELQWRSKGSCQYHD